MMMAASDSQRSIFESSPTTTRTRTTTTTNKQTNKQTTTTRPCEDDIYNYLPSFTTNDTYAANLNIQIKKTMNPHEGYK